jgi:hypothetical protein
VVSHCASFGGALVRAASLFTAVAQSAFFISEVLGRMQGENAKQAQKVGSKIASNFYFAKYIITLSLSRTTPVARAEEGTL